MTTFVALLRGINIGGRTIKMADLKACIERVGYDNVSTVLQSGNIIFRTAVAPSQLQPQLETALSQTFNYPAKVLVYSLEEMKAIIEAYPFTAAREDQHDYVVFMENNLERELADGAKLDKLEQIALGQSVIYWQVSKGQTLKSQFAKQQTQAKYRSYMTVRNIKTLRKLID